MTSPKVEFLSSFAPTGATLKARPHGRKCSQIRGHRHVCSAQKPTKPRPLAVGAGVGAFRDGSENSEHFSIDTKGVVSFLWGNVGGN